MAAYDFGMLIDKMKDHGLDLAEDAAKVAAKAVIEWLKESAAESENKYDDLLIAALAVAEGPIMDMLDKIDGKEG